MHSPGVFLIDEEGEKVRYISVPIQRSVLKEKLNARTELFLE